MFVLFSRRTAIVFSMFLSFILTAISPVQSLDTPFQFAYFTNVASNQLKLNLIDPDNPTLVINSIDIAVPEGYGLVGAQASPDGQWIALILSDYPTDRLIQLYHVTTGQLNTIAQLEYYDVLTDIASLLPIWSPNSQYLAFNSRLANSGLAEGILNTYLYSISTGTLTTILSGTSKQPPPQIAPDELEWSSDSSSLAIEVSECFNLLCKTKIRTFAVSTAMLEAEATVDDAQGGEICDLNWSPDKSYLSFMMICDIYAGSYFSEIYVWDLPHNNLTPLTHFTNPPAGDWEQPFVTGYDVLWFDNQTMLVGAAAAPYGDSDNLTIQTMVVQWPTDNRTKLSNALAGGWVWNPGSSKVAYKEWRITGVELGGFVEASTTVQIASFNGQNLDVLFDVPDGCDLNWSPDGAILNYHPCIYSDSFVFVDSATGEIKEHSLPVGEDIKPAGWIVTTTSG